MNSIEQANYDFFDVESQIVKWEKRIEELNAKFLLNTINGLDFEQTLSELFSAQWKLEQLKQRHQRSYNRGVVAGEHRYNDSSVK